MTDIATRLRRLGLRARLAIAPTLGAAWALARFGPHPAAIACAEHLAEALGPLPVAALRISAQTCAALQLVGMERVGDLLRVSPASLRVRFGEELPRRMDQALGRVSELLEPLRVLEPLAVRRVFDGACVQLEAVLIIVRELIADLSRRLEEQESGVRGLRLEFTRLTAAPVSREFMLGRPSRDAKHLWGLVRPKIEGINLGYGVEEVTLRACWTQTIRHEQSGAWGMGESQETHDREYEAFLDALVGRWGSRHVLAAQAVASHVPEVARQFMPVREVPGPSGAPAELALVDRPSVLLDQPEPAQGMALQPDYPPSWIRWRGREYTLPQGIGPERIATAWWGASADGGRRISSTRDYFKVRTAGATWLWVFRERETGRWFVHGMWA